MTDAEKAARQMLTLLNASIAVHQLYMVEQTRRRPDDREHARRCWREFHQAIEPIEKQRQCIIDALVALRMAEPIQIVVPV